MFFIKLLCTFIMKHIENKTKIESILEQIQNLEINDCVYSECGMPPSSFKKEVSHIAYPSYTITLSGEGSRYLMNNGEWKIHKRTRGDSIFAVSNALSSPNTGCESFGVVFRSDYVRLIYSDCADYTFELRRYPYPELNFINYYYHMYDIYRPALRGLVQVLENLEYDTDRVEIGRKLIKLSLDMLYHDIQKSQNYTCNAYKTFRSVIGYIQEHHLNDILRPDIAEYFNLSDSYVSKLFHRFSRNENFSNYLTRLRLERATHLLNNSNMPTKEIAFSCRFDSYSYFIKKFKKHFGITPKVYRDSNIRIRE